MPIESRHPLYVAYAPKWQRCRDTYDGQDAVKKRTTDYLPKPGGLDKDEYAAYVMRALFYEAVGRTIDGFVGAISRKDPEITVPAKIEPIVEDATSDGMPLLELTKQLCAETILQGRLGLLVDWHDLQERPYFAVYRTEAITNWSANEIVLFETVYEADPEDKFKQLAIEQYRQLSMETGTYTVTLWRKSKASNLSKAEWEVYGSPITPNQRGKPLKKIPFFWLTPLGKTTRIENPPLLGLVNVCMSHYQNSADLEHGRHFTGLPTLYVTGISNDTPINVGSLTAIIISDPNAKVGYAEFQGQGLQSLENALEAKEKMMGVLGASVFHDSKTQVEAAETARIRTSGETSLLTGVTTAVEATLEEALQFASEWMGAGSEKVEVTLNRELVDGKIDGPTLTGLVQAFQAGALSLPQFLFNLQQADMLAPDTELDAEQAVVLAETAARQADAIKLAQATKPLPKAGE